jgi:hypothetical protein
MVFQGNRRFVWNQKLLESAADMQVRTCVSCNSFLGVL